MAQAVERRWWRSYLKRQDVGDYLRRKRAYWHAFLRDTGHARVLEPAAQIGLRVLDAGCGPAGVFTVPDTPATADEAEAPRVEPQPKPQSYTLLAAAEFPDALDLHVDKLLDNPKDVAKEDILEFQLQHVRDYLDRAIRLGIDRVWIIHGKGTGALRNRVHELLSKMGDLEKYQHKYHPKYDYGATEVVLR